MSLYGRAPVMKTRVDEGGIDRVARLVIAGVPDSGASPSPGMSGSAFPAKSLDRCGGPRYDGYGRKFIIALNHA